MTYIKNELRIFTKHPKKLYDYFDRIPGTVVTEDEYIKGEYSVTVTPKFYRVFDLKELKRMKRKIKATNISISLFNNEDS